MKNKDKKTKNKKLALFLKIFLSLLILLSVSLVVYLKVTAGTTMGQRISVYGLNVSGLAQEEAAEKILDKFHKAEVVFKEDGTEVYKTTLQELGYTLNLEVLNQELSYIKEKRERYIGLFDKREDYEIKYELTRNDETFASALSAQHFDTPEERIASTDAFINYDEQQGHFVIVNDVLGNMIDEAKMTAYVDEILKEKTEQTLFLASTEIEIGEQVYQQAELMAGEELNGQVEELNQHLSSYRNTSVTYTFGEAEEVLDSDQISSWLEINENEVSINEEAVRAFIDELASEYNTIYRKRNFKTSQGNEIEVSGNEYGFRIDTDGEFQQLWEDLKSGTAVRRDPVYSKAGLKRNGKDDLAGSYIEVSIDSQHLWLYKDGVLITETDVITGLPTSDRETYRGAWPIAYKASPFTLTSDIYGYARDVTYWMPFVYGQGLHDASWASEFGGEIYKTKGSHGCVNLPSDQAKLIYDTIEGGYPIIIY